tara:strand:- start:583 stop:1182 length:600 start_codon:yes stop_codon:yes gene_type:complete
MYPFRKVILAGFLVSLVLSCAYTWHAEPRTIEGREVCDPMGPFPQMIKIPVFTKAWQIMYSCDRYPQEPTAIAMSMFYMEWSRTFGDPTGRVWRALNKLMVDYDPRPKGGSAYDIAGQYRSEASYGGLALTPSYIWVKPYDDYILCESSLVHELVHISIWAIKGTDGDPDHIGSKFSGWTVDHSALVQRVNDTLCSLGI